MKVRDVNLSSKSTFMKEFIRGSRASQRFFDYTYTDESRFKKRLDDLYSRSFQRLNLARYFEKVHENLPYKKEAYSQIEKLKDEKSVVVVGGQQAGLMTGPLYTVYKAMSIIALAKQQEEQLNVPVVPVFWVAGEDHDLDEIRFVYKEKNTWKKHIYPEKNESMSATAAKLDQHELSKWLKTLFSSLPETEYTKETIRKTELLAAESTTYVDFFMKMMNWFFGEEGLLLLDAHDPAIRRLEIDYFENMIKEVEHIQAKQQSGLLSFSEMDFGTPIVTDPANAHLFLEVNCERRRLDYKDGSFLIKDSDLTFTADELIQLLHKNPELFSNNVVTRPLMQEFLLPVLSFITGPGELLYWATLKEVFHHFDFKMPPLLPRYEATFIPAFVEKWLTDLNQPVESFLEGKMEELREGWFEEVNKFPINEVISSVKEKIQKEHAAVRKLAKEIDPTLAVLSEKNADIIEKQLTFIEQRMDHHVRQQHNRSLTKFSEIEHWLRPASQPQERILHPILLINMIGIEQFRKLLSFSSSLDGMHKVVYL